jgi:hypothetical protein
MNFSLAGKIERRNRPFGKKENAAKAVIGRERGMPALQKQKRRELSSAPLSPVPPLAGLRITFWTTS